MTAPPVTVVIPTLNGGDVFTRCVASVLDTTSPPACIVVDNGSTDGTVQAACDQFPGLRVISPDRNLGFAAASDLGAEASEDPFTLFLNDDALLPAGGLDRLLDVARGDTSAWAWQPLIVDGTGQVESAGALATRTGFLRYLYHPLSDAPYRVFAIETACLLVRTDVFEQLGGFHQSYFAYFEMADLSWRARLRGWESRVVPAVKVSHLGGHTTRRVMQPPTVHFLAYRNRLRSILANTSLSRLWSALAIHVPACLVLALLCLSFGKWRTALAIVRALAWPLAHLPDIREQRKRAQVLRRVPDRWVFSNDVTVRLTPWWAIRQFGISLRRW